MHSIFLVYITAKDALDCRSVTLPLPATPYELLDILDRTRVKDMRELYLTIEEYCRFPKPAPFLHGTTDLYQLNVLAQKLSELDDQQSVSFEGLVEMEIEKREPFGIPRLIDLAYSADCCHVVTEVRDDTALGRFYTENGFIPKVDDLSDELFELLDFQKIGQECRINENGVFTSGGYVVQHTELTEMYKDMDLTLKTPDYAILLKVSLGHEPDHNSNNAVQLKLPAEPMELDAALESIGAHDWKAVNIICMDCRVPALIPNIDGDDNIAHINRLAQKLQAMNGKDLGKLKAVLEATENFSILGVTHAIDTLDEYLFKPQYASPEDMAREFLKRSMGEAAISTLLPYIDLCAYGRALVQEQECALTEYGFISRKDGQSLKPMKQRGMEMM